jgi:hypothetical protein
MAPVKSSVTVPATVGHRRRGRRFVEQSQNRRLVAFVLLGGFGSWRLVSRTITRPMRMIEVNANKPST